MNCQHKTNSYLLVKLMYYLKHHKLRLLPSTKLSLLVIVNSSRRNLLSAILILSLILFVRFPKTGLHGITPPQIIIDRLPVYTLILGQEARLVLHSPSAMALEAIEVIEEVGTIIGVEA